MQEEVNLLNQGATGGQSTKNQCQTYSRKHVSGLDCPGKRCQKCFDCGEYGHFKGAPICKKPKDEKKNKQRDSANIKKDKKGQLKRVKAMTSSDEDSDDSDGLLTDSTCRVKKRVFKAKQSKIMEPSASLSIKSWEGREYIDVWCFPDSGVYRTIITESLYKKLLKLAPRMKL